MVNKKLVTAAFVFLLFSILAFRAEAIGFTNPCSSEVPCSMIPGEERVFDFLLQSSPGDGDVRIRFEVVDDAGGIAQIVGDKEFLVPAGSQNVNARLNVKVPTNANIGSVINVLIRAVQIPESGNGQVGFSPSISSTFSVAVGEEVAPAVLTGAAAGGMGMFFFAIGLVLVVLIVITFVLIRNKDK